MSEQNIIHECCESPDIINVTIDQPVVGPDYIQFKLLNFLEEFCEFTRSRKKDVFARCCDLADDIVVNHTQWGEKYRPLKSVIKNKQLFTSDNKNHGTPQWLFDILHKHFKFTLDVCANEFNHKLEWFINEKTDCLKTSWFESNFMNPPYGRGIDKFIYKAIEECTQLCIGGPEKSCVMLLPARTDTSYFQVLLDTPIITVKHLPGRLKFEDENRVEAEHGAPFPSALVFIGHPEHKIEQCMQEIVEHIKVRQRKPKKKTIPKITWI